MSTGGRDRIHSPEEILAIVQEIHDEEGLPFVTPQILQEHTEYRSDKTARQNLNMVFGEGDLSRAEISNRLYFWIPEGEQVDLDEDDIQPLGSYTPRREQMYWERKYSGAFSFTGFGLALFGIGLGVASMIAQIVPESVTTLTTNVGLLFFSVGIVVMFIGGIAMVVNFLGKHAALQGWISEEPLEEGRIAMVVSKINGCLDSIGSYLPI